MFSDFLTYNIWNFEKVSSWTTKHLAELLMQKCCDNGYVPQLNMINVKLNLHILRKGGLD